MFQMDLKQKFSLDLICVNEIEDVLSVVIFCYTFDCYRFSMFPIINPIASL